MNNEIGIPGSVEDAVVRYAKLAQQAGAWRRRFIA